jgi:hypothetical protein
MSLGGVPCNGTPGGVLMQDVLWKGSHGGGRRSGSHERVRWKEAIKK